MKEIFVIPNLGSRGNEFLAKLRMVREGERAERSNSSAFINVIIFVVIVFAGTINFFLNI